MARRKKEDPPKQDEEQDDGVVNPGDCIGHWLDGDKSCEVCEIQDSCREMTLAIEQKDKEVK